MYSCWPAGRTAAPSHTPSWSSSCRCSLPRLQSLNEPTTSTERAPGKWPTNPAMPWASPGFEALDADGESPRGVAAEPRGALAFAGGTGPGAGGEDRVRGEPRREGERPGRAQPE